MRQGAGTKNMVVKDHLVLSTSHFILPMLWGPGQRLSNQFVDLGVLVPNGKIKVHCTSPVSVKAMLAGEEKWTLTHGSTGVWVCLPPLWREKNWLVIKKSFYANCALSQCSFLFPKINFVYISVLALDWGHLQWCHSPGTCHKGEVGRASQAGKGQII